MAKNKTSIFLSVIVPSYNEVKNFDRGCLDDIIPFLEKQNYSYELILSDDGSTDGTINRLENFIKLNQTKVKNGQISLLKNKHQGKAPTVQSGMEKATGEWRLFTDFDQSTNINQVNQLLKFTANHDIIIGSRKIVPAQIKARWYRKVMGYGFNFLVRLITGLKFKDTQCGFKLFNQRAVKLFRELKVYNPNRIQETGAFTGAFDVELLILAKKHQLKVKETQIKWQHYQTDRVNIVKDSLRMFVDIVRIRLNH